MHPEGLAERSEASILNGSEQRNNLNDSPSGELAWILSTPEWMY